MLGFHSYVIYSLHSLKEEVRADISKLDTSMQQIIKDVKFAQVRRASAVRCIYLMQIHTNFIDTRLFSHM